MRQNYTPHEDREQEAVIQWAFYEAGRLPGVDLIYAIPNGGSRNKIEAAHLKRQGVKAGVPDLFLPVARQGKHGLYIEILKEKTMMMVDARRTVMMACQELGIKAEGLYGKVADAGHTGSEAE